MVVQKLITLLGFDVDQSALDTFDAGLKKAEGVALGVTTAVVGAGLAAINFASDYTESLNKVDVAFGDSSKAIKDWSNTTLQSFGVSKATALDAVALFGDMATGMGLTQEAAAGMGKELVGRAADMASFKNVSIDVAKNALKGVYTGETESLKNLGIVMTQANLQQFALERGITKSVKKMTQAEKVNLRFAFVMEKSKNAAGDFANTAGSSVANQTRIAQESVKELAATFGLFLLPAVTKGLKYINELIQKFASLDDETKKTILTIAGIAAAVYPLIKVLRFMIAAVKVFAAFAKIMKIAAAAQWIFNAALAANPIVLIVLAIIALIAGLVLLYKNVDKVRVIFDWLGNAITRAATAAWDAVKRAFTWIKNKLMEAWEFMKPMGRGVGDIFSKWGDLIFMLSGPFGFLINIVKALFDNWMLIKQAFQEGGIIAGLKTIGKVIVQSLLSPIIKLLGLLSKIPGIGDLAAQAQGALTRVNDKFDPRTPGGPVGGPSPIGGGGGAAGGTVNQYNVQAQSTITVPAGTPQEQQRFIEQDVRRVYREENQKMFTKTRQASGKVE